MSKTVIIGGVAGGAGTAARLRRLDEQMEIILIERGDNVSYANCGLPYYVGDVIKKRGALLVQTPELLRSRYRIDVRIREEAVKIFPKEHQVLIRRIDGTEYRESYDDLVLATGSSPFRPPVPGADLPGIHTLWTVKDSDELRELAMEAPGRKVLVVGGGFIGLESAENLQTAGMEVTLVEALPSILPPFDSDMAKPLETVLKDHGIRLITGVSVERFDLDEGNDGEVIDGAVINGAGKSGIRTTLSDGTAIKTDFVLLAAGVRPNNALAREAGLSLSERGGILTNEFQQTSDPDIWAAGDVTSVTDPISGAQTMIPLAGPANKQARIAADHIAGKRTSSAGAYQAASAYPGTYGASILKLYEWAAGSVGQNEKTLLRQGKKRGEDYDYVLITSRSHAGYYPGSAPLYLKLIFSLSGKILGAQCIGKDGVDKRIDTISTVMQLGGEIRSLAGLELSYAPPFSSAKDPVNMAGFVAGNVLDGLVSFRSPAYVREHLDTGELLILDVREKAETEAWAIPNSLKIPLGSLRSRMAEVREAVSQKDPSEIPEICILCGAGVRAYNAARILTANGFSKVTVLEGGSQWYRIV